MLKSCLKTTAILLFVFAGTTPRTCFATQEENLVLLVIDKSTLKGDLKTLAQDGSASKPLHTFSIAIGKEEGDKFKQGDNKTPEGIYLPEQFIDTDKINPAKYGKRAVSLNFPNLMDKIAGKTGYGIWLHGAGDDNRIANRQVTEGCVAFYNADILKLSKWVVPGHSVVVIAKDGNAINKPEDTTQLLALTKEWIDAWKARDIEKYMVHYDKDFAGKGFGKASYKAYKKAVFASYKNMKVAMEHVRVVTHPKYGISVMTQNFIGDQRMNSKGRKILYWQKNPEGSWQILRESFDKDEFSPLVYDSSDILALQNPDNATQTSSCCANL